MSAQKRKGGRQKSGKSLKQIRKESQLRRRKRLAEAGYRNVLILLPETLIEILDKLSDESEPHQTRSQVVEEKLKEALKLQ